MNIQALLRQLGHECIRRLRKKPRPIEYYLRTLVSRQAFEKLQRLIPDRRELLAAVAAERGVSEDQLCCHLAKHMGVQFAQRVKSFDLKTKPFGMTLDELRRRSIAPVFHEGRLVGVATVDPRSAEDLIERHPDLLLFLSPWREILRCLDESEGLYREAKKEEERVRAIQERARAIQALQQLCHEVEKLQARTVRVEFNTSLIEYEVPMSYERKARGSINVSLKPAMREYLASQLPESGTGCFEIEGRRVRISALEGRKHFALDWSDVKPILVHENLELSRTESAAPRPELSLTAVEAKTPTASRAAQFEPHVLLIDDNPSFRKIMEKYFQSFGWKYTQRDSAEAAYRDLMQGEIAVNAIVCDLHMPRMRGDEFVRRVRGDQRFRDVPIVMLTSDDAVETQVGALEGGADVFISKTSDPRILGAQLKRAFASGRGAKAA